MKTPRRWGRLVFWLSLLCLVSGVCLTLHTVSLTALYIWVCPDIGFDSPVPVCRSLMQFISLGLVMTLGGLFGCSWVAFRAWRRARAPAPA